MNPAEHLVHFQVVPDRVHSLQLDIRLEHSVKMDGCVDGLTLCLNRIPFVIS